MLDWRIAKIIVVKNEFDFLRVTVEIVSGGANSI